MAKSKNSKDKRIKEISEKKLELLNRLLQEHRKLFEAIGRL